MKFSIFNFQFSKKGVSIYLALIIMFILIAIGLGVSLIIVSQMKMMKGMGDSVVAFYAADTGIEHSLYDKRIQGGAGVFPDPVPVGEASYTVIYEYDDIKQAGYWKSSGSFGRVKRAIEIAVFSAPSEELREFTLDCAGSCVYNEITGDCDGSPDCPDFCSDPANNCTFVSGSCSCTLRWFKDPETGGTVFFCVLENPTPCSYQCNEGYIWDSEREECLPA